MERKKGMDKLTKHFIILMGLSIITATVFIAFTTNWSAFNRDNRFVGTWAEQGTSSNIVTFFSNGTISTSGQGTGTWQINEKKLICSNSDNVYSYSFSNNDQTLILLNGTTVIVLLKGTSSTPFAHTQSADKWI